MRAGIIIFFLGGCLLFLFWGRKEQPNMKLAVEKEILLDSTVIGVSTITTGLDVPWEITWGPDNKIWVTEQGGRVSRVDPKSGHKKLLLNVPDVYRKRSMGLLGMAVSRDLKKQPYVFLLHTFFRQEKVLSRLVRYTYKNDTLSEPLILLTDIPGGNGHNGARVILAPDGKLMMSTGDATVSAHAQNNSSINGKILRLNTDGTIPADNPIPGTAVWSSGHRNIQGLFYGANGVFYSSEHGEATDDELNIIRKGGNYGWPDVQGFCDTREEKAFCERHPVTEPVKTWTPTIAPAGIEYYQSSAVPEWNNSVLLTTLKGSSLYVLKLDKEGKKVSSENIYLNQSYGRFRDVCVSPSGEIYISTSNRDWNPSEGFPVVSDDRIIRLSKIRTERKAGTERPVVKKEKPAAAIATGPAIYINYCAACHKKGGEGVTGNFPPLKANRRVTGDKKSLISVVLNGMSGPIKVKGVEYNQPMPAFKFLNDRDVAAVVSYIRTNFGTKAGDVTAADVRNVRKANAN